MLAQVGVEETFTLVESPPPTPLALPIFPDNLSAHSPQLLPGSWDRPWSLWGVAHFASGDIWMTNSSLGVG